MRRLGFEVAVVEIRVLGPIEVCDGDDARIKFRARGERAVLALLLRDVNKPVSVSSLNDAMWLESGNIPAGGVLDHLKKLRRYLRDVDSVEIREVESGVTGIRVHDPLCVDHMRFASFLDEARRGSVPAQVEEAARRALSEWRGTALMDLGDEWEWVSLWRRQLDDLRIDAWRLLVKVEMDQGNYGQALGEVGTALGIWPDHPELFELQLEIFGETGDVARAVKAYEEYRRRLRKYQAEPGEKIQEVYQEIVGDRPLARALRSRWTDETIEALPERPPLIGRDERIAELVALLAPGKTKCVLVSGLAGTGKTALVLNIAHELDLMPWCTHVLFLQLRGHASGGAHVPDRPLVELLIQLGVRDQALRGDLQDWKRIYRKALEEHARAGRSFLIVVDDAADGEQVEPLLPNSPDHRLLVTSRVALSGLGDVGLLDLGVLSPGAATRVLDSHLRVARHHDDRITAAPADAAKVAELCGYLPLALGIAAARLAVDPRQPVADLAEALAERGQRLSRLQHDGASVPAAFDLSYENLPCSTARLFRLLALNPGARTSTEFAAALIGLSVREVKPLLGRLRRSHLLEGDVKQEWWHFHDLVALYARQRLDQDNDPLYRDQAVGRLIDHCTTRAREAAGSSGLPDAELSTWAALVALAADTGRDSAAVELAGVLQGHYELARSKGEWIEVAGTGLAAAQRAHDRAAIGTASHNLGRALAFARHFTEAGTRYADALRIRDELDDLRGKAAVLIDLGLVDHENRRFDVAVSRYYDAAQLLRSAGDRRGEAAVWHDLGLARHAVHQADEAILCYRQALKIYREVRDRPGEARTLNRLGLAHARTRSFEPALTDCEQALASYGDGERASDDRGAPDLARAEDCHEQALTIFHDLGDGHGEAMTSRALGVVRRARGDHAGARLRWEHALALLAEDTEDDAADEIRLLLAGLDVT